MRALACPLVILATYQIIPVSGTGIPMPDWWPAFGLQKESGLICSFLLLWNTAGWQLPAQQTKNPHNRTLARSIQYDYSRSGILSVSIPWLQYIAAVSVPLLHEMILHTCQTSWTVSHFWCTLRGFEFRSIAGRHGQQDRA